MGALRAHPCGRLHASDVVSTAHRNMHSYSWTKNVRKFPADMQTENSLFLGNFIVELKANRFAFRTFRMDKL